MQENKLKKSKYGSLCSDNGLSEAQIELLYYMLLEGPCPVYGTHITLNRPQSTVHRSMNALVNAGLVRLYHEEKGKKGHDKKIYGLTTGGFCYGFCMIVRNKATTYDIINTTIERWQHLCPEILGNWDYIIKEQQEGCLFPVNFENDLSDIPELQLPYEVPNIKAEYWILLIEKLCRNIVQIDQQQKFIHTTSELVIRVFGEVLVKYAPGLWDLDYNICVARKIPKLWESIHRDLTLWKKSFEERAILVDRILKT